MFECLDHPFSHPIALRPLRRIALVVYGIVFAQGFKFRIPLTPIVRKHKSGNPVPANQVVFQKSGCRLSPVVSYSLGFAPL